MTKEIIQGESRKIGPRHPLVLCSFSLMIMVKITKKNAVLQQSALHCKSIAISAQINFKFHKFPKVKLFYHIIFIYQIDHKHLQNWKLKFWLKSRQPHCPARLVQARPRRTARQVGKNFTGLRQNIVDLRQKTMRPFARGQWGSFLPGSLYSHILCFISWNILEAGGKAEKGPHGPNNRPSFEKRSWLYIVKSPAVSAHIH